MMGRLTCCGLGAGLMYLFDPDRGRRRRALARDRLVHSVHQAEDAIGVVTRDVANRARGLVAEFQGCSHGNHPPDSRVEARIRAVLGRVVSHPRAVKVLVSDGRVLLSGSAMADEIENLVEAARSVRGVCRVDNRLQVYSSAEGHPELQGGRPRTGVRPALNQETWSPTTRLAVGLVGGVVAVRVLRTPVLGALAVGAIGVGLAARAFAHAEESRGRTSRDRRLLKPMSYSEAEWASP
jgi:hypothetical protein